MIDLISSILVNRTKNKKSSIQYVFTFIFLFLSINVFANNADYISKTYASEIFPLVHSGKVTKIYVDKNDHKGVVRATKNLRNDIKKVTGYQNKSTESGLNAESLVIIGTIGRSELIDRMINQGKLNVESLQGQWEAFRIQVVNKPLPNVEQALVIVGSDKRGTTFGIYDLAEKIGVSPWHWWADVPAQQSKQLFVKQNTYYEDKPKVKYRGIFLNDEAPALTNWANEKFGGFNHEFYEHVFDLLLRLKANFLWPAMWNNAFSDDDPLNMVLADEYGIVMSNSHHEPMLCADKEWDRRGKGKWDYAVNAANLDYFWKKCAQRNKPYESIYTLGMRGQADTPMSETENIGLLEEIVKSQRKILTETFNDRPLSDVPQVWTLYKEVQGYYEKGMRVPDDVTLLWSDDNWGNIRRLPTPEERKRKGGAGVYYHFDYVGGPRSYRWINNTPIAKIWEQMNLAYQFEANKIWLTNVGDLKPMEYPIDFFLSMAWDPEALPKEKLVEYSQQWAAQQFGIKHSVKIAEILNGYSRHNGRRKIELLDESTYSQLHYNEAETVSAELNQLLVQAQEIYLQLANNKKSAFFQLVLHPIKASTTVFELYNNVAKNRLYASQGRASANNYAELAKENFATDKELQSQYHKLEGGRWNHFMDQTHIGYTHWNNPPADVIPWLAINSPAEVADMGVAVEGASDAWPKVGNLSLDEFNPYGQKTRYIDIFNKGKKAFDFTATPSSEWIVVDKQHGVINTETRVTVSINWNKAPKGKLEGSVFIKGTGWGGAKITIRAFHPKSMAKVKGFVEADGYISIEAASGNSKEANIPNQSVNQRWQEIPLHGRTHSSMSSFSDNIDLSIIDYNKAPFIEYDLHIFTVGKIDIHTLVAPTLNIVPDRGLRFAIAIDNEKPKIIDIIKNNKHEDWQQAVKNGVRDVVSQHDITTSGHHTLRIYMVDIGVTIQKIIINTGELKESYLGPQPSVFIK